MEQFVELLQSYGVFGLFVVSFCESVFSPILPDIMLIPMGLAVPELAIYYAMVATGGSIMGGFVGYAIGQRFGPPIVRKCVSPEYIAKIRALMDRYGGWAIWIAAMAPIPYKFVSISAGAFRISKTVFFVASLFGRAKRFLLEGILIYYYGPQAVTLMQEYTDESIVILVSLIIIAIVGLQFRNYLHKKKLKRCEE